MKTARLIIVTAIAAGLLAFTTNAFAGGKGNGGGNKGNGGNMAPGGSNKMSNGGGSKSGYWWHNHHYYASFRYCPPVIIGVPLTVVPAGAVMEVPGFFGMRPGHVVLDMSGKIVPVKVLSWTPEGVVVQIPFMPLPAPVCAKLVVIGWNESPYRPLEMKVLPPMGGPAGGPAGGPGGPGSGPVVGAAPVGPANGPVAQVAKP